MPRKTEEQKDLKNKENTNVPNKKKEPKLQSTKNAKTKVVEKKPAKKSSEKSKKASSTKSTSNTKNKKTTSTKTKAVSKAIAKNTKKASSTKNTKKIQIVEYYDLPYRYNQTVVKVLAQTPKTLFVYWDISDADRENYKKEYGENFFETTKPVLIVHNDKLNYSFEIDINDFANSWYLQVNDSKSDYRIELGRRPIIYNEKIKTDYIYVSTSNKIESPNDHILFDKIPKMLCFKNVKNNELTVKPLSSLSFTKNMEKIYNIYDLYKELYQNENVEDFYDLSNPSSGNPSSHTSSHLGY